jgi:hypothetical protein
MKKAALTLILIAALVAPVLGQDLNNFVNTGQVKLNCADRAGAAVANWYWAELLEVPGQPWHIMDMVFATAYESCEAGL